MKDCVERDPLVSWLSSMEVSENILNVIKDKERFPTANVEHGTWKRGSRRHGDEEDGFWTELYLKCSQCGYERRDAWIPKHSPKFCEECGAEMS
jgi:hypothetical protein